MKNIVKKSIGISFALFASISAAHADACQDAYDDYAESSLECRTGLSPSACLTCWADAGLIYANCADVTVDDYEILLSGCLE